MANPEPGRRKPKPEWDESAINVMAIQINESLTASRGLLKTLQDELLVNMRIRVEVQKDILHLAETVNELSKLVLKGNGQPPLTTQIATLQVETKALSEKIAGLAAASDELGNNLNEMGDSFSESTQAIQKSLEQQSSSLRELLSDEIRLLEVAVNERIQQRKESEKEAAARKEKVTDRYWDLFTQMLPHLLTWGFMAAYVVYQTLKAVKQTP